MGKNKIFDNATKNIKRNKWLSLSTVLVVTVVIVISSLFISAAIIAKKGIEYYEKRAQVIVFFKKGTAEKDILLFRDKIYNSEIIESMDYISQKNALEIYKKDFEDNPDLLSTVTVDSLPPSLEIRAKSINALSTLITDINKEKDTNVDIDEVMYFQNVVETVKNISKGINISSIILITALLVVTFFLIRITIGFNIHSHADEIKIMNLVGSSDRYIKLPFILEGFYYGVLGSFIAASLIIIPWYLITYLTKDSAFGFALANTLKQYGLTVLIPVNIVFLLGYYLVHIFLGGLIGVISSLSATKKYLK